MPAVVPPLVGLLDALIGSGQVVGLAPAPCRGWARRYSRPGQGECQDRDYGGCGASADERHAFPTNTLRGDLTRYAGSGAASGFERQVLHDAGQLQHPPDLRRIAGPDPQAPAVPTRPLGEIEE